MIVDIWSFAPVQVVKAILLSASQVVSIPEYQQVHKIHLQDKFYLQVKVGIGYILLSDVQGVVIISFPAYTLDQRISNCHRGWLIN